MVIPPLKCEYLRPKAGVDIMCQRGLKTWLTLWRALLSSVRSACGSHVFVFVGVWWRGVPNYPKSVRLVWTLPVFSCEYLDPSIPLTASSPCLQLSKPVCMPGFSCWRKESDPCVHCAHHSLMLAHASCLGQGKSHCGVTDLGSYTKNGKLVTNKENKRYEELVRELGMSNFQKKVDLVALWSYLNWNHLTLVLSFFQQTLGEEGMESRCPGAV